MTKREDLLSKAWTGEQLEIAGKPVILSPVRYSILEYWKNSLFCPASTDQSPVEAMGELLLICSATRDEIRSLQKLTSEERKKKVIDFMLDTEEEFSTVSQGIQDRIASIQAAMVESEDLGKREAQALTS